MITITAYDPPLDTAMGVALHGDLDLEGAVELRRHLPLLLAVHRPLHMSLDLAHVTFLDCSGARSLKWLDRHMRDYGGTLTLVRPPARVLRLLRLLRFDHRLRISDRDWEDGLQPEHWRIIRLTSLRPDHGPSLN